MKLLLFGPSISRRRLRSDDDRSFFLLTCAVPPADLPPRLSHPQRTSVSRERPTIRLSFLHFTLGARANLASRDSHPTSPVCGGREAAERGGGSSRAWDPNSARTERFFVSGRQERAPSLLCRENELGGPWEGRGDRVGASRHGRPKRLRRIGLRDGAGKALVSLSEVAAPARTIAGSKTAKTRE